MTRYRRGIDVQEILRVLSERATTIGKATHIYDQRPCSLCDRAALLRVGKQDLCKTHAFGMSPKDRAALLVARMWRSD